MREYLAQLIAESGTLTAQEIVLHIIAAAVLSVAIYISYWYTHAGTAYSKKFNVSLVTLTILTATVMTVILAGVLCPPIVSQGVAPADTGAVSSASNIIPPPAQGAFDKHLPAPCVCIHVLGVHQILPPIMGRWRKGSFLAVRRFLEQFQQLSISRSFSSLTQPSQGSRQVPQIMQKRAPSRCSLLRHLGQIIVTPPHNMSCRI